jgi:hypothetical protein
LQIGAKIKSTEQTDLEITFYCNNCILNNTDQNIVILSSDSQKKRLACQNSLNNSIILISNEISKVTASIQDNQSKLNNFIFQSKNISQAFPLNIAGISNRISILKEKEKLYDFIMNTSYSLVSPTDSIFCWVTTINPLYVICNYTKKLLLVA